MTTKRKKAPLPPLPAVDHIATSLIGALRDARLQASLSQEAVARLAGLSNVAVHYFESGQRRPSLKTFLRIASVVGVSLRAARTPQDIAPGLPRRRRQLLARLSRIIPRLTDDQLRLVIELAAQLQQSQPPQQP